MSFVPLLKESRSMPTVPIFSPNTGLDVGSLDALPGPEKQYGHNGKTRDQELRT
jgi:hypothetical protein